MARWTASAKWAAGPALDGQRDMPLALRLSEGLGCNLLSDLKCNAQTTSGVAQMGKIYSHLSDTERWTVESKLNEGLSFAAIGRTLKRHRSTIMRESRRGHWSGFNRYLAEFGRRYYWRKRVEAGSARCKLDAQMLKPVAADNYLVLPQEGMLPGPWLSLVPGYLQFQSWSRAVGMWACGRRRRRWATLTRSGALSTDAAGAPPGASSICP